MNVTMADLENMDKSVLEYYKDRSLNKLKHSEKEKGDILISVIITTYNRSDLLKRAIESILLQSYENIEIIVVDDNSTDDTKSVLVEYDSYIPVPFSYLINSNNQGPSVNRKKGLEMAHGDLVIFMDDDDFYCNINAFKSAIGYFQQYKNLSFVSGNTFIEEYLSEELTFKKMNVSGYISGKKYFTNLMIGWDKPKSTFSTIFKKESLYKAEAHKMEMFNDSTIYLKALLVGDAYIDDDIWGVYYIHSNNISSTIDCKFIVQNLEEKYIMSRTLINTGMITEDWLIKHFKTTIKYFFSGNNINNLHFLVSWINKQENNSTKIKMKKILYSELMKSRIKKLIFDLSI